MSEKKPIHFNPDTINHWVAQSTATQKNDGTRLYVLGEGDCTNSPAVVVLEMPPGYRLFRHAHTCYRFEIIVKGSLKVNGEWLSPGCIMTAKPGEFYGPHTAGEKGCTTAEVFSTLEGVFRLLTEGPEGLREYDARKSELPEEYEALD